MAYCLHNAGTSIPGDQNMNRAGRLQSTSTAKTLCALALADNRPQHLPDANCYADEIAAYEAKYHINDDVTWGYSQAYATLASTPVQTNLLSQQASYRVRLFK